MPDRFSTEKKISDPDDPLSAEKSETVHSKKYSESLKDPSDNLGDRLDSEGLANDHSAEKDVKEVQDSVRSALAQILTPKPSISNQGPLAIIGTRKSSNIRISTPKIPVLLAELSTKADPDPQEDQKSHAPTKADSKKVKIDKTTNDPSKNRRVSIIKETIK